MKQAGEPQGVLPLPGSQDVSSSRLISQGDRHVSPVPEGSRPACVWLQPRDMDRSSQQILLQAAGTQQHGVQHADCPRCPTIVWQLEGRWRGCFLSPLGCFPLTLFHLCCSCFSKWELQNRQKSCQASLERFSEADSPLPTHPKSPAHQCPVWVSTSKGGHWASSAPRSAHREGRKVPAAGPGCPTPGFCTQTALGAGAALPNSMDRNLF